MKRNTVKMILFALFATGLCAAAFAGANEAIFFGEVGKTLELPDDNAAASIPPAVIEETPDFTSADYEVWDRTKYSNLPESSVTAQDAADTAAAYLWRMFDYDPKGKAFIVEPTVSYMDGRTRLNIYISNESGNLHGNSSGDTEMYCTVDVLTGEILSASLSLPPVEELLPLNNQNDIVKQWWEDSRDEYLSIAGDFGEKHFQSEKVSAEIVGFRAQAIFGDARKPGEEDEEPLVDYFMYDILVRDAYGRGIVVSVTGNTKEVEGFIPESAIDPYNMELNAEMLEKIGLN